MPVYKEAMNETQIIRLRLMIRCRLENYTVNHIGHLYLSHTVRSLFLFYFQNLDRFIEKKIELHFGNVIKFDVIWYLRIRYISKYISRLVFRNLFFYYIVGIKIYIVYNTC